jgi:NAD(P)-dependent dehydrogenase (short-subunit alcohol dehydrogenase family)
VFQTNLHGPALLAQLCVPLLRKSTAGRVINVSSAAGQFSCLSSDRLKMDPENLCISSLDDGAQ